jgi:FtsP/CotA-like multicopper oxidase with cupredoxin domain
MITRRDFLKSGVSAGAGLLIPFDVSTRYAHAAADSTSSPPLTRFVDPLPVPGAISPDAAGALFLTMESRAHRFHDRVNLATGQDELGSVATFGYGGAEYLGPTIVARRGQPVVLTVANNLGAHPMAAWINASNGISGMDSVNAGAPRAVVHLHGGYTQAESDGGPLDYHAVGTTKTYTYANDQQATTLWYHDHALSITRLNVYAGLAGFYLLRDEFDTGDPANNPIPNLPVGYGRYEIPLAIQDKRFTPNGSGLDYTPNPPSWAPEFFGDVAVVNGKTWPNLKVEPAVYRFRILNGSQARFYNLSLSNGAPIYQIGTDSGLLNSPVPLTALLIAPGERADVLIDFSNQAMGAAIVMQNDAPAPYPSGKRTSRAGGIPLPDIMKFTVSIPRGANAVTALPGALRGAPPLPPRITELERYTGGANNKLTKIRNLVLFEAMDATGEPVLDTLNIVRLDESDAGANGIVGSNAVVKNTLEQWNIINLTGDVHPIHLHLVQFQLLDRQNIQTSRYLQALNAHTRDVAALNTSVLVPDTLNYPIPPPDAFLTGRAAAAPANERGWKDTIQCPPGEVTRILVPFGNNAIGTGGTDAIPFGRMTASPFSGRYVWHCHILDHEENEMMNFYNVV